MSIIQQRKRQKIDQSLRNIVWDTYIGPNIYSVACPLCSVAEISKNTRKGWETAHIIADKFFTKTLSKYYLYPSCSGCNSECSTLSIFDFLYTRGRHIQLKKIIWQIYSLFCLERPDELDNYNYLAVKFFKKTYGIEAFPAGGGIKNNIIYDIITNVQILHLSKEIQDLNNQILKKSLNLQKVVENK